MFEEKKIVLLVNYNFITRVKDVVLFLFGRNYTNKGERQDEIKRRLEIAKLSISSVSKKYGKPAMKPGVFHIRHIFRFSENIFRQVSLLPLF